MRLDGVTSLGMVTNLGRDVRTACAAARAGVSRLAPVGALTTFDPDSLEAPLIGASIVGLTDGFVATGTFIRLALIALTDLIRYGGLPGIEDRAFWSTTGLVWCLPQITVDRFMWPEEEVVEILQLACAERLRDVSGVPLAVFPRGQLAQGHIGAAAALSRIDALAGEARAKRVVLLGTDSYMDHLAIRNLLEEDRVKSGERPAGLVPGEAGAAVLLEESASPSSTCGAQCRILSAAAVEAAQPLDEEDVPAARRALAPQVGAGLARIVGSVLDQANCKRFEGTVFLDLNGEEWKAVAWGVAQAQLAERIDFEQSTVEFPCVSFGEIGAASGVVALCMGARAFVKGYANGDQALVLSIGDGGQVSAIVVQATG
jgi:3-oxoacyl-[acyl-carrier-protein] synthase I